MPIIDPVTGDASLTAAIEAAIGHELTLWKTREMIRSRGSVQPPRAEPVIRFDQVISMSTVPTDFIAFLLERLELLGGVTARRMFGGHGLFRGGAMFGLVADDVLYLKVDDNTRFDFEQAGSGPFTYNLKKNRKPTVMKSYWEVPPVVLGDAETFRQWCETASNVAIELKG